LLKDLIVGAQAQTAGKGVIRGRGRNDRKRFSRFTKRRRIAIMQKPSSSVSSGNISPAIMGPSKDSKEVYVIGGLVLILAIAIGAVWFYSQDLMVSSANGSNKQLTDNQVSTLLKNTSATSPLVEPIVHNQIVPTSTYKSDSIHTDIYFEVGRKGLTDDAKAILATQADLAKNDSDLGILVQGYTDQQGSVSYNNKLGLMRAEKVKEFLVGQGVSDQVIKVVSLGKDGALCLDSSDVCRNMNRRVHLEIRKIGKDHMILPTVATEPKTSDPIQSADDQNSNTDGHGSLSATDPSPLGADPASGS
jgi:peptidoglycan-associated lipoprotein